MGTPDAPIYLANPAVVAAAAVAGAIVPVESVMEVEA
jgi:homoaconitase/3-isopropylmalate dehydratase large subunit